ncbi:MAG: MarR family winged helix-turn-helix transcriptional regulator [Lachnospiraceae bacterium]
MKREAVQNEDVGFYIKKLDNHIQRNIHSLYNRKEVEDCSLANMRVADYLYHQGSRDVFQKDIEAEFFINRATASKMLSLMEEKGLICRETLLEDARLKRIRLLPKGEKLHRLYKGIRMEMEEKLTGGLSQEEIVQFKMLCQKMLQGME